MQSRENPHTQTNIKCIQLMQHRRGAHLVWTAMPAPYSARCGEEKCKSLRFAFSGCCKDMAMQAYVLDWVNLPLRTAHVITAIAWIGSSFYFVFLENSLTESESRDLVDKSVDGELWAVHGALPVQRHTAHRSRKEAGQVLARSRRSDITIPH